MDDIVNAINIALDNSSRVLRWYIQTGDKKHMKECGDWIVVANIYMSHLIGDNKHENV